MSLEKAFNAILPHLPAGMRAELASKASESEAISTLNLGPVEDPANMRWLVAKRITHSQGASADLVASLERKLEFLDESLRNENRPAIWLGYVVRNNVREVFLIDLNRSAILVISEPLTDSESA